MAALGVLDPKLEGKSRGPRRSKMRPKLEIRVGGNAIHKSGAGSPCQCNCLDTPHHLINCHVLSRFMYVCIYVYIRQAVSPHRDNTVNGPSTDCLGTGSTETLGQVAHRPTVPVCTVPYVCVPVP